MAKYIDAGTLKSWLADGLELGLFDVREHGQYGERHLFFAIPLPYSVFELRLPDLAPNPRVRLVLYDEGDGVAERAAARASVLGYSDVSVLRGGAAAWQAAGEELYAGVNVPSKAFGELVEVERHTPHVTANELKAMIDAGENMVIVDGRTPAEFHRVSIPGGRSCPNGELALRIDEIAPDPETTIVVNCAGRTRSIIGAQTLIDLAVPNRVVALENGTQGWALAGLELNHGATDPLPSALSRDIAKRRQRVRDLAETRGVRFVEAAELGGWLSDPARTTYVIDVRGDDEVATDGLPQLIHAPGGQLVQATDGWIGVRGARVVVADSELVRAPVIAAWLRQLGHEAYVLAGGVEAARGLDFRKASAGKAQLSDLPGVSPTELKELVADGGVQIVDLRPSMSYRQAHIRDSVWSIRPRLASIGLDLLKPTVLIADEPGIAEVAAIDLAEAGATDVRRLVGGVDAWRQSGLPIVATQDKPADDECIDFLFFTHRRLTGDAEHSRQYLTWEIGLVEQLREDERAAFRIVPAP